MKKLIIIAAAAAILLVIVVASLRQATTGRGTKVFMEDASILPSLVATVSASGEVRPREEVNISSQVPGQIVELRVEEGDQVRRGDVLVQLDPERYRSEVLRLEAQLRMANVDIEREEVGLRTAESNLRRLEALYSQKVISDDQVEQARLTVDSGRIALKSRIEQVKQAEADLARVTDDLSKTTLRAPMGGRVTAVNAKVGEQVIIGTMNNPGTVILTLSDMTEVLAEVRVDETDVTSVEPGQDAEVRVDAVHEGAYHGKVETIGNAALRDGTVSRFPVKIKILDPDERLRPGMSAHASIQVDERKEIVAIPLQALVRRSLKDFRDSGDGARAGGGANAGEAAPGEAHAPEGGGADGGGDPDREQVQVVLLEREGKVRMVKVETGISDAFRVEIIEGVAKGDHVILGPYRKLRSLKNGDLVQRAERSELGDEEDEGN